MVMNWQCVRLKRQNNLMQMYNGLPNEFHRVLIKPVFFWVKWYFDKRNIYTYFSEQIDALKSIITGHVLGCCYKRYAGDHALFSVKSSITMKKIVIWTHEAHLNKGIIPIWTNVKKWEGFFRSLYFLGVLLWFMWSYPGLNFKGAACGLSPGIKNPWQGWYFFEAWKLWFYLHSLCAIVNSSHNFRLSS